MGVECGGVRLDVFLADRLGSRTRAQRLIEEGRVTVDANAAPKRHLVVPGERVRVDAPAAPADDPQARDRPGAGAPAVRAGDRELAIAYEDSHLMVVDKPAGLVVHPARGHQSGTLAQLLVDRVAGGDDATRPGLVHRLDRDTSGLLLVARSELVHRRLKAALVRREIVREYLSLVEGRPPARSATIDAPVGRDRSVRTRMSVDSDRPREARTHFEVAEALARTTLLRVRLETGRTHQIRVHLQAIGHPVCGDRDYGHAGLLGLARQFLHAHRLILEHPVSGEPLDLTCALPADLAVALARARTGRGD